MYNCYMLLNNKRDFHSVFFNVSQYRIYHQFLSKNKAKKNFKITFFPKGGLNPRPLVLKFTAFTTRPKDLTQDIDKNDGTKWYRKLGKNLSFLSRMSLIFKIFSEFWIFKIFTTTLILCVIPGALIFRKNFAVSQPDVGWFSKKKLILQ